MGGKQAEAIPSKGGSARKVVAVNLYYAPDVASSGQLLAELCEGLAESGLDVMAVAGQPSYSVGGVDAPKLETLNGVEVHRVSLGGSRGRERMLTRVMGYVKFMWRAWRRVGKIVRTRHPDFVVTLSNPPVVGLIGAYMAWRHKTRFIYVLYDIHPDVLLATNWIKLPRLVVAVWNAVNRWIVNRAEVVVVLGNGMKATVEGKGVSDDRVLVIPIWGRPELEPMARSAGIREELGIGEDEIMLLNAGNMGIMHPLEPIIDAAAMLGEQPVRFVFVGDGAKRQMLTERVEREALDRVMFLPYQPEQRFTELLAASDACFVAFEPGMEKYAVPSRAYTFLSAARPLITLMAPNADVAELVNEKDCGWNVTTGDDLAELIRRLVDDRSELTIRGRNGRAAYEARYRRGRVIHQYVKLMQG